MTCLPYLVSLTSVARLQRQAFSSASVLCSWLSMHVQPYVGISSHGPTIPMAIPMHGPTIPMAISSHGPIIGWQWISHVPAIGSHGQPDLAIGCQPLPSSQVQTCPGPDMSRSSQLQGHVCPANQSQRYLWLFMVIHGQTARSSQFQLWPVMAI